MKRNRKSIEFDKENGQATVELAMMIPVLAVFLMLILQVALVVRGHVLVANASRAAARELSVDKNQSRAVDIAHKNSPNSTVTISRPSQAGQYLTVSVKETVKSSLPIVGIVFPDVTVSSRSVMRVEK